VTVEITIEITGFQLFDNLALKIAKKYWCVWIGHTKIEGKQLIPHFKPIPATSTYILKKLVVTVLLWKSLWKSLFFNCLIISHWTLPTNVDGFSLAKPKLSKNSSF